MRNMRLMLWLAVLFSPSIGVATSISDYFARISEPEIFYADATTQGYTVQRPYSGPVEVIVSGLWWNNPPEPGDAFYSLWFDPPHYDAHAMCMGFDGCAWVQECGAASIVQWIVFIEGIGAIAQGTVVPPFAETNEYHFVIDLGPELLTPTIGIGDGGVYDNAGGLDVIIYQVEEIGIAARSSAWGSVKRLY